jgi:ribose transport system substrate-binding protein
MADSRRAHVRIRFAVLTVLVGLPLAVAPTACQRGPAAGTPRIALVMKSLANEFFKTMADGASAHQRAHAADYELIVNGIKDELDVARQIDLVEQMIAQRVDALVLAPADSRALVPVIRRAHDAGIVIVNIDNRLDAAVLKDQGIAVPFVGPDNRKGARLVGDAVAAKLTRGDGVAIIEGAPNAFNGVQRKLGFDDAIRAAGLTLVSSQTGNWEAAMANQVAAALLSEYPNLKALLCANDSMALGAVAAVRAAGREGQVLVAGFDNISAVQQLVREGRMVATADQHGDQLAVYGIEYAREMLAKKAAPSDRETPVDLITAAGLR